MCVRNPSSRLLKLLLSIDGSWALESLAIPAHMSGSELQASGQATGIRGCAALDKGEMCLPHSGASARKLSCEESRWGQSCSVER